MPGRPERRRALAAALAIPAVGIVALGVALAHRSSPLQVHVNPPPSLSPLPSPTAFPPLFVAPDDFSLGEPRAYGAISAPPAPRPSNFTFDVQLAGTPIGLPTSLPVWRLAPAHVDPSAIAARFGLAGPDGGLTVDTDTTLVSWTPLRDTHDPALGGRPRDTGTAVTLAERWLDRSGMAPPPGVNATAEQTSNGESAAFAEWTITWPRAAPTYPSLAIDSTVARVSADGTLKELELQRPVVAGGSVYPLRPWRDAVADAGQGRWLRLPQPLPDIVKGGVLTITVTITVGYAEVHTAGELFAVPVYVLTEPGNPTGAGMLSALAT